MNSASYFYAESGGSWFVCLTDSLASARKIAAEEFGWATTKRVRTATEAERKDYERQRGPIKPELP